MLPLNAQSVFITPRAGLNMSNITGTEGSIRTGLNFGLSGEYVHSSRIGVEGGIYYSMQGSRFGFADVSPEHNYINIPVLLKYYVDEKGGKKVKGLSIFGGPQLDIKALVNKVGYSKNTAGILLSDDMTRQLGSSFVVGGEYLFENGLALSANMNIGLSNKAKARVINYGNAMLIDGSYRDTVFQVKFGYRFSMD
jgi:hypothetical protein